MPCGAGLLRQVLWNLAENGLKYRRRDVAAELEIEGHATEKSYDLRVSDNGIGMSLDEASHIFDPFYRAPRVREVPGTGLGLSIVKRIVHASGGTVAVSSKLGEGSTFIVNFPLSKVERGRPRI